MIILALLFVIQLQYKHCFYQSAYYNIKFEKSFRMKTNMKLPNMVITCSDSTFFK